MNENAFSGESHGNFFWTLNESFAENSTMYYFNRKKKKIKIEKNKKKNQKNFNVTIHNYIRFTK